MMSIRDARFHERRHTPDQLQVLITEVSKNPSMCDQNVIYTEDWRVLAETLNAMNGPPKSVTQWKAVLNDWLVLTERVKDQLQNDKNEVEGLEELLSRPLDEESLAKFEAIIKREKQKKEAGLPKMSCLEKLLFGPMEDTTAMRNLKRITKKMEKDAKRFLKKRKLGSLKQIIKTSDCNSIVRTNDSISIPYSTAGLEAYDCNDTENKEPDLMRDSEALTPNSNRVIIAKEPDSSSAAANGKRLKILFASEDGTTDLDEFEDMKLDKLQEMTRDLEHHISFIQDRIHLMKDLWKHRCGDN